VGGGGRGVHPAVRVAGILLAVVTAFLVPAAAVPFLALAAAAAVAAVGIPLRTQLGLLAGWWPLAVLVLVVHTLTTTSAAPLGQPSWVGLLAGGVALLRVGASAGYLAVLLRTTNLDELVAGVRWWWTPWRRLGARDEDLALALAVALGTAPALLGEARRVEAVRQVRRGGGADARRGLLRRARDRAEVVVPLLEALGRRAEALSLSLRRRRPTGLCLARPPAGQVALLVAWVAVLAALAVGGPAVGRW
jgi:energy-coupling factor transporter transmembrane protein EcfT